MASQVLVVKPQVDRATVFMVLRALVAHLIQLQSGVKAEGEMGLQSDGQNFSCSLQRGHLVFNLHLWVETGLMAIRGKQSHTWFLGGNGQFFPILLPHQGWTHFIHPRLCFNGAGKEASNVKLSAQHVNVRIGDGGNPTQSG